MDPAADTLVIDDLATGGDGVGRGADGRATFVPGTAVGDTVRVEIVEERKRFRRGRLTEVVAAGPSRVAPPCPHVADGCGGCGWQHLTLDAQRDAKRNIANQSVRRLGASEPDAAPVDLAPPLAAEGFRTTLRLRPVSDEAGRARLGFRAAGSHDVVPIDSCLVAHPALAGLLREVDWAPAVGTVDELTLRVSVSTGSRMVVADPAVPPGLELPDDVHAVSRRSNDAHRVTLEETVDGRHYQISAGAFFQTRTDGAAALVELVREFGTGRWGRGHLVDLYGGVGLFSVALGAGMRVTVVEANRQAAADARVNLQRAGIADARVLAIPAERWRPEPAQIVIADPPRAGLVREVIEAIGVAAPGLLITVHCDAASFGRDAGRLGAAGWRRTRTMLVDLFPHTPHVELVSAFAPNTD